MKKYFEVNIPKTVPSWMHPELAVKYSGVVDSLYGRFDKLNEALELSGMDGNDFAAIAKVIFDQKLAKFEVMTAKKLADAVSLLDDGTKAEPRLEWPNCEVVVDTAFTTTKEWEVIRCLSIGGSDASIIHGVSPYTTERRLYHDKIGTPLTDNSDKANIFKRGHFLEDDAIAAFCKVTGAKRIPETRMFRSITHEHVSANVDAFLRFPDGKIFFYESKTTIEENFMAWANDKIPAYYVTQIRQYPAVLCDPRIAGGFIGCLFTKDYTVAGAYVGSSFDERQFMSRRIERDSDAEFAALEMAETWWQEHIEVGNEPPPSGVKKKDIADVAAIVGPAQTATPVLSLALDEFDDDIQEYLVLVEERKALEKQVDGYKEREAAASLRLIEALGEGVEGKVQIDADKYYEVKYSPRCREKVDTKTLKEFFPDAAAACCSMGEEWRVFSVKEKKEKKAKGKV